MLDLLRTQLRVIGNVAMREINAQQASLMYGYVWAFVDVGLTLLGLLIMKLVLRVFNPPGLPPATFVLSAALPWFMFQHMYTLPGSAILRHRKLLSLPVVTELDVVLGASIQVFVTYSIVMIVTTTISSFIEHSPFPKFPLGILLLVISACVIGLSLGMILMLLNRAYPPANKFVGFVLRFGLFLSSVYLPLTRFPTYVWPYLTWNPMLHVEELLHQYWFASYVSPVGSPLLIMEWILGLVAFGLLCERYTRFRLPIA